MEGLHAITDPSPADRLSGRLGEVGGVAPRGFPADDPAVAPHGRSEVLTWAQVCAHTGRIAQALMQWRAITASAPGIELPVSDEGLWRQVSVQESTLEPEPLTALLQVLTAFTRGQECYHALWEGWGWIGAGGAFLIAYTDDTGGSPPSAPTRAAVPR